MKLVIQKTISMLVTLLAVSFLVFLSFQVISGDPAVSMLGTTATEASVEQLREEMGLNDPLMEQYGRWLVGFIQGDMGTSYSYQTPVEEIVLDKLPITIVLTILSFIIVVALALPLGIYCAKHQESIVDRGIYIINQVIMAVPPFFSGILITLVFGLTFRLFTPGGYISYKTDMVGFLTYLIFPAIAIALPKAAMTVKLLRSSLLTEKKREYVRTAYSRGNSSKEVFNRHILKNAIIPVITFLGMALADIVAGSIIIEQVFSIPGIGRILLSAISSRDYPVAQAIIVCMAGFILLINLLVDLIYRWADPRIET